MAELKCQCVRCDKEMENLMEGGLQPNDGLAFRTHGHYGSTEFDPMNESWIDICLCDECLRKVAFLSGPPIVITRMLDGTASAPDKKG